VLRPGPRGQVAPGLGELGHVSGELPRALEDPLLLSLEDQGIAVAARGEGFP
jgi:hypothetical protein